MELFQFVWGHGTIPIELLWTILILVPKGNADTRLIGLLGILWKVMEAIIDTCIKKFKNVHDALHIFCAWRGMGTAIMELNIAQDLASVNQDPLLLEELRRQQETQQHYFEESKVSI